MDRIPNDQSKYGETALVCEQENLFMKVWEEEVIPEGWLKGVIIVIKNRRRETLHTVATTEASP